MALVENLSQAIARFEGFFLPASRAARNNNPGNLRIWGTLPRDDAGYAIFPTPEAGWAALRRQVTLNISRGLTLEEFFAGKPGVYAGYAPAADRNQPANYARTVADWLDVDLRTPLATLRTAETGGEPPGPLGGPDLRAPQSGSSGRGPKGPG